MVAALPVRGLQKVNKKHNLTLITSLLQHVIMRLISIFPLFNKCKMCATVLIIPCRLNYSKITNYSRNLINHRKFLSVSAPQFIRIPTDEVALDDDNSDLEEIDLKITAYEGYARDILYKNSKGLLLTRIYNCASVQELLNIIEKSARHFRCEHFTQTVFVLYDFLKIYQDYAATNMKNSVKAGREFFSNLQDHSSFQKLLCLIESSVDDFDINTLSYCYLYLNKLGLSCESTTMRLICEVLKAKLVEEFSLSAAARFLETIFSDGTLRPYFVCQELIPLVFKEIESCTSAENLNHISISLNKLNRFVTGDVLMQYKDKVESLIEDESLSSSDYKAVLQIISFLNYPKWRDKNTVLMSKCMLLIRNNLNDLNINEISLLYEIFFRIQEPGDILNDLQRCSYKYFHQLDDVPSEEKISLYSTIIFFTAPQMRNQIQNKLKQYVAESNDFDNLLHLRRLLTYMKTSDIKLCNLYWDKILRFLKPEETDVVKLSQHYFNFSVDIDNYRHKEVERVILDLLSKLTDEVNFKFFPHKMVNVLEFVLLYGDDARLLDRLVCHFELNWSQLTPSDCLKLSHTLKLFSEMDKKYVKLTFAKRIDNVLNMLIHKEIASDDRSLLDNNSLLKSCVYKNKVDTYTITKLLERYADFENLSSKTIENLFYCFIVTNTLSPEIMENIVEYILRYRDHVLGFNVSRIIYLCYVLGYRPKKSSEFCETAVDIIIRDQSRMTGLSLVYSALALCFFNKLPNSIVRSIFNVEFMDKLDNEIQQCYSKDKYPNRVRYYLMQLNRAVCLDYPECNVPWFHQKYVEENFRARDKNPRIFSVKVKDCLRRIIKNRRSLMENVLTPYGFVIDFVVYLNSKNEVAENESQCTKRLALLLIPEYAYTRINTQLKGSFQLQRRHLEILGYRVVFVKSSDWISFYYPEDRIEYLKQLMWPKICSEINRENFR